MKNIVFFGIFITLSALMLSGCERKAVFGFTSGDCNEVYTNCMNKCLQSGKPRVECANSCEQSRGMCASIKVKGCMQDCNKKYGKGTIQADGCQRRCKES